jgi:hypothetical protein
MGVGVTERLKSSVREQALTMGRRIDLYLTENMPDLVAKYDLATKRDLANIEKQFAKNEGDIDDLEDWRDNSQVRIEDVTTRIIRLEAKYGIERREK